MRAFLWNIFLAAVWTAAWGGFTLLNLAVGFVLGYAVLSLGGDLFGSRSYSARLPRLIEFLLYFAWEVLVANLRLAYDVITPRHRMRPGVIAVPLEAETDGEILLLASVITLTPGTLSLDVSPDRKFLYVHSMYILDAEDEKRKLKHGFERRILALLR
ncbi:MAG: Na+/H+ antiporter subunit E [Planctomycetaceae bacterium]|nr:Na+/H+ antiporter subunit E [Planctomycetaceae bacterium]